jgi:thiol:disulfide interchange protein
MLLAGADGTQEQAIYDLNGNTLRWTSALASLAPLTKFESRSPQVVSCFLERVSGPDTEVPSIRWHTSVVEAFQTALRENKPLVVYFYKSHCDECGGPCQNCTALEENVLQSEALSAFADQAVFVKIDTVTMAAGSQEERIMNDLGVTSVPVVLVLDAKAEAINEVVRIVGELPLATFLEQFMLGLRSWDRMQPTELAANP